jgi:hypothetical protein
MGSTDPELPRPGTAAEQFVIPSNHTGPIRPEWLNRTHGEERGEANAGDDIETPNTAAGPSGSSEGTAQPISIC